MSTDTTEVFPKWEPDLTAEQAEHYAKAYIEHHNQLRGPWKDTKFVTEPVTLQFNGRAVYLNPNGTYQLGDTSG